MAIHPTALVIGNAAYPGSNRLRNPANDANDISAKLQSRNFVVIEKTDCTRKAMDGALKEFRKALADSQLALFFFAGHGMQIDGENYLAPIDADFDAEEDAKHTSISLDHVIDIMDKSNAATKIVILDACRNNPFERAWNRSPSSRGLAPVYAPRGTIIAYATSPGQYAADGKGRNGEYTAALLQHIDTPDCSLETMFKRVRNTLSASTKSKQISWEHTSLSGEFYFNLSLGARIDDYSATALSDHLFVLDDGKPSHRIIHGIKSCNWHQQNSAIERITPELLTGAHLDSLFVLGRNIYQAACGYSHSAQAFLDGFMSRMVNVQPARRKAVLDGMLFEVFFDSKAQLRKRIKDRCLQQLFVLQQHEGLQPSFAFIAECLLGYPESFHAIPGKERVLAIDVVVKKKGSQYLVKEVLFEGSNILREGDDELFEIDVDADRQFSLSQFKKWACEEMVVPDRLLNITHHVSRSSNPVLLVQTNHTLRKGKV